MATTNKVKQIEINSSSIVDLKAELFRKQEEVRLEKNWKKHAPKSTNSSEASNAESTDDNLYNKSAHNVSKLSKKMLSAFPLDEQSLAKNWRKEKQQIVQAKIEDDLATKRQEDLAIGKSREMLEKKAKLYEQLASGSVMPDPDNEDLLVNFDRKYYDNQRYSKDDDVEEELVEYEDEFGRTRRVKRKDLPQYETTTKSNESEFNERQSHHYTDDHSNSSRDDNEGDDYAQSDAPYRTRRSNVHYEDVRDGENRDHGVSFFAFSADEEVRAQQMEMLEKMRLETESKKSEKQRIKDKRKKMLKEKLAKVAARKGIAFVDEDSDKSESEPEEKAITIEKAKLKPTASTSGVQRIRDWDLGKEGLFAPKSATSSSYSKTPFISQDRYISNKRDERNAEFAPPSIYHDSAGPSSAKRFKYSTRAPNNHSNYRSDEEESQGNNPSGIASMISDKLSQIRKNLS